MEKQYKENKYNGCGGVVTPCSSFALWCLWCSPNNARINRELSYILRGFYWSPHFCCMYLWVYWRESLGMIFFSVGYTHRQILLIAPPWPATHGHITISQQQQQKTKTSLFSHDIADYCTIHYIERHLCARWRILEQRSHTCTFSPPALWSSAVSSILARNF